MRARGAGYRLSGDRADTGVWTWDIGTKCSGRWVTLVDLESFWSGAGFMPWKEVTIMEQRREWPLSG